MSELVNTIKAIQERIDQRDWEGARKLCVEGKRATRNLAKERDDLLHLAQINRELASILELNVLLDSIMDRALKLVDAERGFVVLKEEGEEGMRVAAARMMADETAEKAEEEVSRRIVEKVLESREPLATTNAQEDPRLAGSKSIAAMGIRSVLAVPLMSEGELMGAIYVDTRVRTRIYGKRELKLLGTMADQAAVALRIARLYGDLEERNRELAKALDDLKAAQEELVKRERLSAVGQMAASIIHDIKNPMTAMKGFAQMLGRENLAPEKRALISKRLSGAIDRFVGMTQEILDYTRGGGTTNPRKVSLGEFIEQIEDFAAMDIEGRGITLEVERGWEGEILMDDARMTRVILNLISNARDVLPEDGRIRLATSEEGGMVKIAVEDNGSGIPPEIMKTLFEPFVTQGKKHGTGLGLAIVKKIVEEEHHGRITVSSTPGVGTSFTIMLPKGA